MLNGVCEVVVLDKQLLNASALACEPNIRRKEDISMCAVDHGRVGSTLRPKTSTGIISSRFSQSLRPQHDTILTTRSLVLVMTTMPSTTLTRMATRKIARATCVEHRETTRMRRKSVIYLWYTHE
jgi:hypothetical protein